MKIEIRIWYYESRFLKSQSCMINISLQNYVNEETPMYQQKTLLQNSPWSYDLETKIIWVNLHNYSAKEK